jgi:hypothetical protein
MEKKKQLYEFCLLEALFLKKKLKLPWQPIHNPTDQKQSKFSQNSTILEMAKFLSVWNIPLYLAVVPALFLLGR